MNENNHLPDAEVTLGRRLRDFRKARGMTLADVGKITGLTVSTLSKIENGKMSLNFNTVLKLSIDLALPISNLIGPVENPAMGGRRSVCRNGEGHFSYHRNWDMETLCDDLVKKRNVHWKMTVKCRSVEEYGPLSTHLGEEFLYVISGSVELYTELYKPLRLNEGDSIQFDSMTPHAYIAISEEDPVVLMCNTVTAESLSGFDHGN